MLEATPANVENAHHDDFRVVVGEEVFRSLAGPAGEPADLSRALASEAPRLWLGDAGRAGASSDLGPGTPLGARPALGGCGPNVKVVSLSKSLECEAFGFTNIPDSTSDGRACLRITEVLPEGLLAAWNSARPQQRLGPGDRIFSVNGVEEDLVGMRDLLCGPTVTLLAETAGGGPLLAAASPAPGVAAPAAAWPLAHGGQPVASPHGQPAAPPPASPPPLRPRPPRQLAGQSAGGQAAAVSPGSPPAAAPPPGSAPLGAEAKEQPWRHGSPAWQVHQLGEPPAPCQPGAWPAARTTAVHSQQALLQGELQDRDRQLRELQLQLDLWRRLAEPATGSAVPEPGAGLGGGDPAGRPRSPPPGRRAPPRQEGPAASEGPRAAVIIADKDREIQELQRSLEAARQEARAFDCPPAAELRPPAASPPGAAAEALPWSESLASAPAPRMLIAEKDGEIQELQRRLEAARRETRPPECVPALGPRPAAAPPAPSQPRWPESPVAVLADKDREIQELQRRLEVARQEASAVDRAPAPVQRFAAAPPSGGAAAAPRRPESPAAVPALSTSAADREQGIQELQRRLEVGRPEARAPGCAAAPDLRPAAAMPEPLQPCWPGSPAATSGPRPAAAPPASWQPRWLESPVAPAGPGHPLRAEGEGPWCRGGGAASCPASPAPCAASAGAEVARARAAARGAAAVAAAAGGRPPAMGGAVPRPPKEPAAAAAVTAAAPRPGGGGASPSLLDELGRLREVFWSMECGEAGSPHGPAASALLQEGARRERRLEAERREQALEIDRLRKLLEGEQARRLLELAAEEAKREDGEDDQLVQSLAAAARDASIQDAELHELAFCARTQATGSDAAARQLREARAEAESAAADAAETRARLRAEEGAAAERGALAERLRGEAAQARLEAERAAGDAAETRARLQGSEAALAEGSALAERLRGEAAQARAEAERALADAAEARARLKGSEAALAERDGLVDRLEGEVAQQRSELEGLRQSPPVPAGRRDSSGSSRAAGERQGPTFAGLPVSMPAGGAGLNSYLPGVSERPAHDQDTPAFGQPEPLQRLPAEAGGADQRGTPAFGEPEPQRGPTEGAGGDRAPVPPSAPPAAQQMPAQDYVSQGGDALDKKLEQELQKLGAGCLKGHKLERTGPNKYKLGEKRVFMKLDGSGNVTVRDGTTYVPVRTWLGSLKPV